MPRLNEMPRLVLLLVCGLSRAVWAGNPVTGEICADRRATETCAATQDVVLVVDNSGSVSDRFDRTVCVRGEGPFETRRAVCTEGGEDEGEKGRDVPETAGGAGTRGPARA